MTNSSDWDTVGKANYVSFTSYRKDGSPVATPIWIAPSDGKLYFFSDTDAYKVKRIRRNPAVTLQASNIRGKVTPGSPVVEGKARVLEFDDSPRVRKIINRKYWLMGRLGEIGARFTRSPQASIAIEISPS
ncbi:PPOX class F420-dependent oxidoreductase [Antrihabitans stalactiti]|uniref:PPOX class F420-dependent oxidoreductase n=1 Tax=Antrihabitans stalactiti TaxID=2584121 RepID=A0A848KDV4_9NOCA|nr:PPOX class F420-dependent oxidoreductase [Antrihabitans stalactiti]NMN95778.1 PPOX class F420-dependent oxidoreductase [Antrihabitans stalactiti]